MRALVAACWWLTTIAAATEVDLLGALAAVNASGPGVSVASPLLQQARPSFHLQGDRELQVPAATFSRASDLLRSSPEFSIIATVRQEPANSGSIVSFSHGYNRYLELQSSGRRDEIRFHYVAVGTKLTRVETFPYRLADNEWHKIALTVSGTQAQLLVDCHPLYRRIIPLPDRNFTESDLSLWVGQRNSKHSLFKGTLQDVRLISGPHGYLVQCPGLDSECPTCGQFSLLQATVEELASHLQDLSSKLSAAEARVEKLEQCDCQKSCYANETLHADGASWQQDCNLCACVHGDISCRPVKCPKVECKSPVIRPGECCPTCLKECLLFGTTYDHGDRFTPKECAECVCHDGNMECRRVDQQTACPPLPCDEDQQFSVPDECCKFCPGVDYCSMGHTCDENATCMNLNTKYTCKCNEGFHGDGIACQDIDECTTLGGLEGHHCHSYTRCVNTIGSYLCECIEGYTRADKYTCTEIDECSTGSHLCSDRATCRNTAGSYVCECLDEYIGDGIKCEPICQGGCLNGGTCVAPDWCACVNGFTGSRCEADVDECKSPTPPRCPAGADCLNMPGWYYCRCRSGYRSDETSTKCLDIDECSEGTHTCHSTATCLNTEGSFTCQCTTSDCQLSCISGDRVIPDGMHWLDSGGCRACSCRSGVLHCDQAPCPCDASSTENSSKWDDQMSEEVSYWTTQDNSSVWAAPSCCPHCQERYNCRHQELHHVTFRSGERWLYQCLTCECLLGEVDCWETDCGTCCGDECGLSLAGCPSCQMGTVVDECLGIGLGVRGIRRWEGAVRKLAGVSGSVDRDSWTGDGYTSEKTTTSATTPLR